MDDIERRRRILEEERLRAALRSRNKAVGLLITFFFPVFGFLYSTNYVWALVGIWIRRRPAGSCAPRPLAPASTSR